jgi:hypothetical protein
MERTIASGQRLVVEAAEHHDGHVGSCGAHAEQCLESLTVREHEVQQNDVELLLRQRLHGLAELLGILKVELSGGGLLQGLFQQTRISRIVFHQQHSYGLVAHVFHLPVGRATSPPAGFRRRQGYGG